VEAALSLAGAPDFRRASEEALAFLQSQLGMGLWMVTRVAGDDWIVLTSNDRSYDVHAGDVFAWTDSFCSRMVEGKGPRIAPVSDDVPAYREAPIGRAVPIGAYVGVPLHNDAGGLFGTLCAIDPNRKPAAIEQNLPLVELIANLLSGVLAGELRAEEAQRAAERSQSAANRDHLTGLVNRRGWETVVTAEEDRCRRHGHPAVVIAIDLNDLKETNDRLGHAVGDRLLCASARAIENAIREHDVAARLGGDEFAVLAVECDPDAAKLLVTRLEESLEAAGVRAAIGFAARDPRYGLGSALDEADCRMYENKRNAKQAPLAGASGVVPLA
jgi:diguanylate cyclase